LGFHAREIRYRLSGVANAPVVRVQVWLAAERAACGIATLLFHQVQQIAQDESG
jgi:hypothetical protein